MRLRYIHRIPQNGMLHEIVDTIDAEGVVVRLYAAKSAPVKAAIRPLPMAGADWGV